MTVLAEQLSATQLIGNTLDALIGRLSYDEEFAKAIAKNPLEALDRAGIHLEKEAIEQFIKSDPHRFDLICDRLSELISPDTLVAVTEPTCG